MEPREQAGSTAQSSQLTTERIKALMEISKKVPELLHSAGQAINTLTSNPQPSEDSETDNDTESVMAKRREVYQKHISAYFRNLKEITNSLENETNALVDAKLVPVAGPKKGTVSDNDGLGNLDIGYLNSRTRDVGLTKEAELVKEMRTIIEQHAAKQGSLSNSDAMDVT